MLIQKSIRLRCYWLESLVFISCTFICLPASSGILDGLFDVDIYIELPDHQAKLKLDSMLRPMSISDEVQALWFEDTTADPGEPKIADICPGYASQVNSSWRLSFYSIAGNVARVYYSGRNGSAGESAFMDCLSSIGMLKTKLRIYDYVSEKFNTKGIDHGKQADPEAVFASISNSHPSEVLYT